MPPNAYMRPGAEHPRTTTILVLGILSLTGCMFLTGIPAWVMGRSALREIDASAGQIGGRSIVHAGTILGIIGTVLGLAAVVIYGAVIVIAIAAGGFDSGSTTTF